MGNKEPRVRQQSAVDAFFAGDAGSERWRHWARGHDRSAEYDCNATVIRKGWFGRRGREQPRK